jgi:hypothetical protein
MTPGELRARRPEFRTVNDILAQAAIDEAVATLAPDVYGPDRIDRAISLKAADILARSPFGRSQRLVLDDGSTIYSKELQQLSNEVAIRMIVI